MSSDEYNGCSFLLKTEFAMEMTSTAIPGVKIIPVVVLPLQDGVSPLLPMRGTAAFFLNSLADLAISLAGSPARFAAYGTSRQELLEITGPDPAELIGSNPADPCFLRPSDLWRKLTRVSRTAAITGLFMNASFLISEKPNYAGLVRAAAANGMASCGDPTTGDLYAFAIRFPTGLAEVAFRQMRRLAAHIGMEKEEGLEARIPIDLPYAPCGLWNSPAMEGSTVASGFRHHDAPLYLNTALQEVCFRPNAEDPGTGPTGTAGLKAALVECREASKVPWVFNELINEIDFQRGSTEPASLPVELHLAVTGACNIDCKFCSCTTKSHHHTPVRLEEIQKLDFLSCLRTLRMSSGNGEPTLNRELPAMIQWVRQTHPHLGINFFSNGILLDQRRLIPLLVSAQVSWINISINASTREQWKALCQADHFERVCRNLRCLMEEKRGSRSASPFVQGSMVLTRENILDLPNMPALCRELGIDRFVALPFFALGIDLPGRYTEEHAYHHSLHLYDQLYEATIEKARELRVSVELPAKTGSKRSAFAVEARILHDFAGTERNEWQLGKLLHGHQSPETATSHCHFLWRSAAVGCAPIGESQSDTHWMYPCLGPLASVVTARQLAFNFPDKTQFLELWNSRLYRFLRGSQHAPGECAICDTCRGCDTRQPHIVAGMKGRVADFISEQGL